MNCGLTFALVLCINQPQVANRSVYSLSRYGWSVYRLVSLSRIMEPYTMSRNLPQLLIYSLGIPNREVSL